MLGFLMGDCESILYTLINILTLVRRRSTALRPKSTTMYQFFKPLIFKFDAEKAHDATMKSLRQTQHTVLSSLYTNPFIEKPVQCFGMTFKNPVGLAAGLDKNGECIDAFAAIGFGFIEIGTVTPKAQKGNPKPRLFRLPSVEGIINRMGFNNKGVDYLVDQVRQAKYQGTLGINIGKNKDTPEDDALSDYLHCLEKVFVHASYVTVNISSPNTPGLRNLQYGDSLNQLLDGLKQKQLSLSQKHHKQVPILIKIAPDLSQEEITDIAQTFLQYGIDGVVATNTTLDRSMIDGIPHAEETGGLSGAPVKIKSQNVTEQLSQVLKGQIPIVGVGGISCAEDANKRIEAGASLVQCYSALIYQGPTMVNQLVKGIKV